MRKKVREKGKRREEQRREEKRRERVEKRQKKEKEKETEKGSKAGIQRCRNSVITKKFLVGGSWTKASRTGLILSITQFGNYCCCTILFLVKSDAPANDLCG